MCNVLAHGPVFDMNKLFPQIRDNIVRYQDNVFNILDIFENFYLFNDWVYHYEENIHSKIIIINISHNSFYFIRFGVIYFKFYPKAYS